MTRVIAGAARGRRLAVPPGQGTRPTSDRAREGLFSALESTLGGLDGVRVLDLYAGSGAVGLEAASRGAVAVLLVESDRRALEVVRTNVASLGLAGTRARGEPVERLAASANPHPPYDLAFLDPPYVLPEERVRAVLVDLLAHGWLAPDAVVVVERATRDGGFAWPAGFAADRSRTYGEATLWYGRAAGSVTGSEPVVHPQRTGES
jgi:16S rRNA (guanine966-N2)-methyltransferase